MSRGIAGGIGMALATGANQLITSQQDEQDRNKRNQLFDAQMEEYNTNRAGLLGENTLSANQLDTVLDPHFNPIRQYIDYFQNGGAQQQPLQPATDEDATDKRAMIAGGGGIPQGAPAPAGTAPLVRNSLHPFAEPTRGGGLGREAAAPAAPSIIREPSVGLPTSIPAPRESTGLSAMGRAQAQPKVADDQSKVSMGLAMSQQAPNIQKLHDLSDKYDQLSVQANAALSAAPENVKKNPTLLAAYKAHMLRQLQPQLDGIRDEAHGLMQQVALAHIQDMSTEVVRAFAAHDIKGVQSIMQRQGYNPALVEGMTFGVDPESGVQALVDPKGKRPPIPVTPFVTATSPDSTVKEVIDQFGNLDKILASNSRSVRSAEAREYAAEQAAGARNYATDKRVEMGGRSAADEMQLAKHKADLQSHVDDLEDQLGRPGLTDDQKSSLEKQRKAVQYELDAFGATKGEARAAGEQTASQKVDVSRMRVAGTSEDQAVKQAQMILHPKSGNEPTDGEAINQLKNTLEQAGHASAWQKVYAGLTDAQRKGLQTFWEKLPKQAAGGGQPAGQSGAPTRTVGGVTYIRKPDGKWYPQQ